MEMQLKRLNCNHFILFIEDTIELFVEYSTQDIESIISLNQQKSP